MSKHDIRFAVLQHIVKLDHEVGRLLKVGREDGEVFAAPITESGGNG